METTSDCTTAHRWDECWDVAIVGSGIAGLAAAIEAARGGARVCVFEKMKIIGGNSRISDGALSAPGNYLQKRYGINDTPDLFASDLMRAGLGCNHPELVRTFAHRAAEAIDWIRHELGIAFQDRLDRFGGHSVPRSLTTKRHCGAEIISSMKKRLGEMAVPLRCQHLLRRLWLDSRGHVRGLVFDQGKDREETGAGRKRYIGVNRAVVLATGGFAADVVFRSLQQPQLDDSFESTNQAGATAEGLIAALRIGALPVHLSWIQLAPWACPDEKGFGKAGRFASYTVFPAGILVDPSTGERIVNEWADRRLRTEAMVRLGRPSIGIVDAAGAALDEASLEACLCKNKVHSFGTIGNLADFYGMPRKKLETTVEEYNAIMAEGRQDSFGKCSGNRRTAVAAPPFYAVRLWPRVHYTPGGIGITSQSQVLDLQNRGIAGLYAAGEVCGGIHGASRLGGCALTECLVFGRIAGRQASAPGR